MNFKTSKHGLSHKLWCTKTPYNWTILSLPLEIFGWKHWTMKHQSHCFATIVWLLCSLQFIAYQAKFMHCGTPSPHDFGNSVTLVEVFFFLWGCVCSCIFLLFKFKTIKNHKTMIQITNLRLGTWELMINKGRW